MFRMWLNRPYFVWSQRYDQKLDAVVDAAENNPTALTTARHGEVASHFSMDEHTIIPSVVVMSNCAAMEA